MADWQDDFTGNNGDPPDPNFWVGNSGIVINNNKARGTVGSSDHSDGMWLVFDIDGDFDVQVDWACVSGCGSGTGGWGGGMTIRKIGDNSHRGQVYFNGSDRQIITKLRINYNDKQVNKSNSSNSGKFRIVRSGGTWTIYYDTGSGWTSANSRSGMYTGAVEANLWVSNWSAYPSGTFDFDNFSITADTIHWAVKTTDLQASLEAAGWSLDDLAVLLRAHDGLEFRDLPSALTAAGVSAEDLSSLLTASLESTDDLGSFLQTWGIGHKDLRVLLDLKSRRLEDLPALLHAIRRRFLDLASFLSVTDGKIMKDMGTLLTVTDGTVRKDLGMVLAVMQSIPAFRAVTAQRVSSVVHEVN